MQNNITTTKETMTSTQLLELIKFSSKSELNRAIRNMFSDKIDGAVIASSIDSRGYVSEYLLPELESKMFVAKHDINYLEKITQYWIDKKEPQLPNFSNPAIAARAWADEVEAKQAAMIERDHAIATKAQINDKRTATIMGKLGNATKKINKLESKLQDEGLYMSLLKAELPDRVDTEVKPNVQTWRLLLEISKNMGILPVKVADPRYKDGVNTYHVDVISRFKELYV